MDASEGTPQPVHPADSPSPCEDGEPQQHSQTLMSAEVSKVLYDDDLLIEIFLRLGFLTTLVRAALVCKRWLDHVSNRKFLCRFRKLHPPRLLGYYVSNWLVSSEEPDATRFVPMLPQPPELANAIRRVECVRVNAHDKVWIKDCRNGSVFTGRCEGNVLTHLVHRPLCPESGLYIVPPLPKFQDQKQRLFSAILSKEEEGDVPKKKEKRRRRRRVLPVSHDRVQQRDKKGKSAHIYAARWCLRMHTLATNLLDHPRMEPKPVLIGNKIYMPSAFSDYLFVLDLTDSSFSNIQLPQGVKYYFYNTFLSRADDASSVYLIDVPLKKFQLRIWLHKGGNWLLVDTICLREMCVNLGILDHTLEDERIGSPSICQVGDNAEFVFLRMCGRTCYLDVTSRTLRQVFPGFEIYPFVMIWPPTFPALKDGHARNAM